MFAETKAVAMARPYTKPVQPAWTSKAPALVAPILSATIDAVAGMMWSGEIVATMHEVELGRVEAALLQAAARGDLAQVARRLVHPRDAALADARARE